jgi:hypothetical protein
LVIAEIEIANEGILYPMPIQHAIWKVGTTPEALTVSKLATEKDLEDMITARPEMISSGTIIEKATAKSFSLRTKKPSTFSRLICR